MFSPRFLVGVAVGAAAAALLDPARGRGRRAQLVDRTTAKARRVREQADRRARYGAGVREGEAAMKAGAGTFTPADDVSLAAHLHGVVSHLDVPDDLVNLEVVDGVVRLRGQVDTTEQIGHIVRAIASEPGVRDVESYLHLPGEAAPNKEEALAASARAMRSSIIR